MGTPRVRQELRLDDGERRTHLVTPFVDGEFKIQGDFARFFDAEGRHLFTVFKTGIIEDGDFLVANEGEPLRPAS